MEYVERIAAGIGIAICLAVVGLVTLATTKQERDARAEHRASCLAGKGMWVEGVNSTFDRCLGLGQVNR